MAAYQNPERSLALIRPAIVKANTTLALVTSDDSRKNDKALALITGDNTTLALMTGDDGSNNNMALALITVDDSNGPQTKELTVKEHLEHLRMTSATRLDEMLDDDPNTNDPYFTFAPTLQLRQSVSTRWDNHVCSL